MTKPEFYLLDGHAIAYRAYFAFTSVTDPARWQTSAGEPTAGTYGFASLLMRLLEKDRPTHLAVAFDTGKTFRNEMFPLYKATRAKMPDDLRPQIERMRQLVDAFGFPRLEMEGFEADDVLGSASFHAASEGHTVKIITGDRDLLQLVTDQIVVNIAGGKFSDAKDYSPEGVLNYLGVRPDQVVDYKGLVGDTSDNYPGVAGIGPKTAVALLSEYDSLQGIYAHLDALKPTVRAKLEANQENAWMSYELAKIKTDLDVCLECVHAETTRIDFRRVEEMFRELEFRSLLPKLREIQPIFTPRESSQLSLFQTPAETLIALPEDDPALSQSDGKIKTVVIQTRERLSQLTQKLSGKSLISIDTETTGTDPMNCHLVGISLSWDHETGYYIPVGHLSGEEQLPLDEVRTSLNPVFNDPTVKKAGHNIKYDLLVLKNNGFTIQAPYYDTMVAAWVIDPASRALGLKPLAQEVANISMQKIEELIGKGKNQLTMAQVPVQSAAPYAAADAVVVLRLIPLLEAILEKQQTRQILDELELPLIPVLTEMEQSGIRVDKECLNGISKMLSMRILEIEKKVFELVGYSFNLNSTQQLSQALFDALRLPPPNQGKKTAAGFYSTAADVLEGMKGVHPVIDLILEHREYAKIKSTYADALPQSINAKTGRVHTSFNQTGTVTGRLASTDPNLQNIPTRTEIGRQIRDAFVADPGSIFLSVDYSQIELRIIAHLSGDRTMLDAFRAGKDIHATTASAIYGCPLDEVTKEMRRHAKAINFGLIYGMGVFGLSQSAGITREEASIFTRAYFAQFPGIKQYLESIKQQAAEDGYVETMMGRRRYFPNLKQQLNVVMRNREEREAINAPVQGSAADIMKKAMLDVQNALSQSGLKGKILLQVHDELLLECPVEELHSLRQLVQKHMEETVQLSIPLSTEARCGRNWGELAPMNG